MSSGIGVRNTGGDNSHTIDNSGWTDFVLLQFANPVRWKNARFNTGWHSMNDTDATMQLWHRVSQPGRFASGPDLAHPLARHIFIGPCGQ